MRSVLTGFLVLLCSPVLAKPPLNHPAAVAAIDPASCLQAASVAEHALVIPTKLLAAIAEVESIRADPATHRSVPWPWTINVEGVGHFYETKQDAIDAVKSFQAAGAHSIDVGCMQINLMYHPSAFASLEEAFDPGANALYAARFLRDLYRQTSNWPQATAFYHSQTPSLGTDYATNVLARWPSAGKYTDAAIPAAASGATVKLVDYSVYTPEFAATLKSMDRDLAQVGPERPARSHSAAAARVASSRHVRGNPQPS